MTGTGREPVGPVRPVPGRTAARVAAGLSIGIVLFEVAVLLGAPWDYLTQVRHALGLPPRPWKLPCLSLLVTRPCLRSV